MKKEVGVLKKALVL